MSQKKQDGSSRQNTLVGIVIFLLILAIPIVGMMTYSMASKETAAVETQLDKERSRGDFLEKALLDFAAEADEEKSKQLVEKYGPTYCESYSNELGRSNFGSVICY